MPVSQDDIDALNRAIADGVRTVTIGGDTTTYNTTDSLIRARDDMQRQLDKQVAQETGKRPITRVRLFHAGRGYL